MKTGPQTGARPLAKPDPDTVLFFYTTPMLMEFVMGMVIAVYVDKLRKIPQTLGYALVAVSIVMAVCLGLYFHFPRTLDQGVPAALLLAGCLALDQLFHQPTFDGMKRLGDASYSLYLTHPIIIMLAAPLLRTLWWPVGGIVFVVLCCVAALISYTYIEKPLLRFFRPSPAQRRNDAFRA